MGQASFQLSSVFIISYDYIFYTFLTMFHTQCCNREPFLTGISHSQGKTVTLSYVVGKLSFIDTPKIYDQGSNVEGKVSAKWVSFSKQYI